MNLLEEARDYGTLMFMEKRLNIFDYNSYLEYLQAEYKHRKSLEKGYSYQKISEKGGFENKGYVYNLFQGKKPVSSSAAFKLSKALEHTKAEAEFFLALVHLALSSEIEEKKIALERVQKLQKKSKKTDAHLLSIQHYELFSETHHLVIRSLIDMFEFSGDFKWLSKMVYPEISVSQAKKSVQLLMDLGLVEKEESVFQVKQSALKTPPIVAGLAIQDFYSTTADLAKASLKKQNSKERSISGLTLGISETTFQKMNGRIQDFKNELREMADSDENANRVYQLNLHLFPLSKKQHGKASEL